MDLISKYENVRARLEQVQKDLTDPAVIADNKKLKELSKEHSVLSRQVTLMKEFSALTRELAENRKMLDEGIEDEEFKALVEQEVVDSSARLEKLDREIRILLVPASPDDDRNIIMEIRAGTGGEEAALFAGDLYRMYTRFAEAMNWKIEQLELSPGSAGGFKEVIFSITGSEVYRKMQYESGVHRVQRVPATESSGRIHTSAVSVAVLPEPEAVEVYVEPKDLRIDTYRSSGPGGQSVNTMDSAIRITHIPTGTIVQCQDEKSQRRNKEKAMRHLRAKLLEIEREKVNTERSANRRSQIGSGDRSEKIRTYNYPQNRVTDHRIGFTSRNLTAIMDGNLDDVVSQLMAEDYKKRLEQTLQEN